MRTRTVAAVIGLLAGAGSALAQTPPLPAAPLATRAAYAEMSVAEVPESSPVPTQLPPPGAQMWRSPDSPQFPDLGHELESDPVEPSSPGTGHEPGSCKTRPLRYWASAEYLMWWFKDGSLQSALLTSSPTLGSATLGSPGNTVAFGGRSLDFDLSSGGRVAVGVASPCQHVAIEASGFMLQEQTLHFAAGPGAGTVLARPVINGVTGGESALLVSAPGSFVGGMNISASSKFYGGEGNVVGNVFNCDMFAFDLIAGFRFLDLTEDLEIDQSTASTGGGAAGGNLLLPRTSSILRDAFRASNQFYGGQIGAQAEYRRDNKFITISGKFGVGTTSEMVDTAGSTTSGGTTTPGGLLALSSNIGHLSQTRLSFMHEVTATTGLQITEGLRIFVGYNWLYWDEVARPGNFVDRRINPALVPSSPTFGGGGPNLPPLVFRHADFWAQGLNFGLAFRY